MPSGPGGRNSVEVKELVEEIRRPFRELDKEERFWHTVEDGTYDYGAEIPPDLYGGKENGKPAVAPRRNLTPLVMKIVAAISQPYYPVPDLSRVGQRAENETEQHAAWWAHVIHRNDRHGRLRRGVRRGMARSRFAATWLQVNAWEPPKPGDFKTEAEWQEAYEDYVRGYWRWKRLLLNPKTVGFDSYEDMKVAVIEEEIPIVRLSQYLPDEFKDANPMEVMGQYFPGLRAGPSASPESQRGWYSQTVTRCTIDDGNWIVTYVNDAGGRDPKKYQEVWATRNTFGKPSLTIYPGNYRDDDENPKTRFEAMIAPAAQETWLISSLTSLILTIGSNPRWAEEMPPDVAKAQMDILNRNPAAAEAFRRFRLPQKDKQGRTMVGAAYGAMKDVTTSGEIMQALREERAAAEMRLREIQADWAALFPNQDDIDEAAAASVAASIEQGMKLIEDQQLTIMGGETEVLLMIATDIATSGVFEDDAKKKTDQAAKPQLLFRTYGREVLNPQYGDVEPGTEFRLSPSQFKGYVSGVAELAVEPLPDRRASQIADQQSELALMKEGLSTPRDVLIKGGERDPDARLIEVGSYINTQQQGTWQARADAEWVIKQEAARLDIAEEEMMAHYYAHYEAAGQSAQPQGSDLGGGGILHKGMQLDGNFSAGNVER